MTGAPPPEALTHTLYFIRHGETDWNVEARLQGQRDVPLNDFGRVQAEEAGARLRGLVPAFEDLDYVASPLSRTRETMERMREAIALHPRRLPRRRAPARALVRRLGGPDLEGGPPARSARRPRPRRRQMGLRAAEGRELRHARRARRAVPRRLTRDTVVVSHGGVARVLLALLGQASPDEAPRVDIWQGRVLVFAGGRH